MTAHPRRLARLTVVIALTYVVGQLAALEHLANVAHVPCPEHGDSLHVEPAEAFAPGPQLDATASVRGTPAFHEPPEHEHCASLSHVQPRAVCLPTNDAPDARSSVQRLAATTGDARPHGLAPRVQAPKQSPPAPTA